LQYLAVKQFIDVVERTKIIEIIKPDSQETEIKKINNWGWD
jgi:hypothetical protein